MSDTMPERIWGWRSADKLGSVHGWGECAGPGRAEYVRSDIHAATVAKRDEWYALWQEVHAAGYEQKARADKAEARVAALEAAAQHLVEALGQHAENGAYIYPTIKSASEDVGFAIAAKSA